MVDWSAWRNWIPKKRTEVSTVLITLLTSVAGALCLVTFLTAVEMRSSLRERALLNLRQTLSLQRTAYNTYLEDLRESTLVAAADDNVEQETRLLINEFMGLSADIDRSDLEARLQRQVLLPSKTSRLANFQDIDAATLLPQSKQGLALQQLYIANANRPSSELISWPGPGVSAYDKYYRNIHESLELMLHAGGFYDIFLVSKEGDIVFSLAKEFDLGTNLLDGPYADSGLGQVVQSLRVSTPTRVDDTMTLRQREDLVVISEVAPYLPSGGAPSLFTGSPIYLNGTLQGYLCTQVNFSAFLSRLNNNRDWESIGLGKSGDLLLINSQSIRISESRRLLASRDEAINQLTRNHQLSESEISAVRHAKSSAGILRERGKAVSDVLNGKGGQGVRKNIFGDSTLSAWTPVASPSGKRTNANWGMIASEYESEIYAPLRRLLIDISLNAVLTMLIVTVLGLWLSNRLVSPLVAVQILISKLRDLDLKSFEAREIPAQLLLVAERNSTEVGDLAKDLARLQEELFNSLDALEATNATVDSLCTPISSVSDGVLLLPLIGQVDANRSERVRHAALEQIAANRARFFIWDLTGLVDVDGGVAPFLNGLCQAANLLGCRSILSGVSAALAARLSGDGLALGPGTLSTSSLQDALALVHQDAKI